MLKIQNLIALIFGATCACIGSVQGVDTNLNVKSTQESEASETENIQLISEAFGNFIGRNLNSPGVQFDLESIIKGIRNGAAGKPSPMSDQDYEKAMHKLQEKAYETLSKDNLNAANEFMKTNAQKEGVTQIEPGKLQYTTLKEGHGEAVAQHGTPLIHYTGKYLDGTEFGSSKEAGGPISIPLDQTIPGFSKGLLGMKEGEQRRLFIHPDLGYGTLGNLPPNALLVFDIEVVKADSHENADLNDGQSDYDDEEDDEDEDDDEGEGEEEEKGVNKDHPNANKTTPKSGK